jgi:hypothetical protein
VCLCQAKKEYNYARFFSILRSPSTPYLFGCVMFKYVELMRKVAFRIMSKSFGARKKDTGEAIYDAYPLSRLTELLCFEDSNEARCACKHYNIAVEDMVAPSPQGSSGTKEVIFWRRSDFKEPVHPEKGFVLPLRPRKMTRIIESKLNGATRLAVCRGEVSGEGAILSGAMPVVRKDDYGSSSAAHNRDKHTTETVYEGRATALPSTLAGGIQNQKAEFTLFEQKSEPSEENQEQKSKEAVCLRRALSMEELERKERARKIAGDEQNSEAERLAREQRLVQERRELEAEAKRCLEVEKHRMELLQKRLLEEQIKMEAERRRKAEEIRKAEERNRQKKEWDELKRKEADMQRAREREQRAAEEVWKRKEEAEKRRKENDAKRMEILRKEIEQKRRKEAEERKKAREWKARADSSRRFVLWSRWKRRLARRLMIFEGSKSHMDHIDPTFVRVKLRVGVSLQSAFAHRAIPKNENGAFKDSVEPRRIIEQLLQRDYDYSGLSISSMVIDAIRKQPKFGMLLTDKHGGRSSSKTTLLLKVGVVTPRLFNHEGQDIAELVNLWIGSRLRTGKILSRTVNLVQLGPIEVRSTVVCSPSNSAFSGCDVAIFVVPPSRLDLARIASEFQSASSAMGDGTPSVCLVLGDIFNPAYMDMVTEALATNVSGSRGESVVVCPPNLSPGAFESALESVCMRAVYLFLKESCVKIVRTPTTRLASVAVLGSLWRNMSPRLGSNPDLMLELASFALDELVEEVANHRDKHRREWERWPASEFVESNEIQTYFSASEGLPGNWIESLGREQISGAVASLRNRIDGSFGSVMQSLLVDAKPAVVEECRKFTSQQRFRKCLETALMTSWNVDSSEWGFVYLPNGLLEVIVENALTRAGRRFQAQYDRLLEDLTLKASPILHNDPLTVEDNPKSSSGPRSECSSIKQKHDLESTGTPLKRRRLEKNNSPGQCAVSAHTGPSRDSTTKNVEESAAFSRTLELLARGETVDTSVGDTMLSRILKGIPGINASTNI